MQTDGRAGTAKQIGALYDGTNAPKKGPEHETTGNCNRIFAWDYRVNL